MTLNTRDDKVTEVSKVSLIVFNQGHLTEQHWISMPLDASWMAFYRVQPTVVGEKRRTRIAELRIVPTDSPARFGLEWNYEYYARLAKKAGRTITLFPFDAVRRFVAPRHFDDALAATAPLTLAGQMPPERDKSRGRRGAGRPGRPLTFYAQFAVEFDTVENDKRREAGFSTRTALARKYKVPDSTIGKWIYVCRQRGLLTARVRGRGKRGGRATEAARDLCKGGAK